MAAISSSCSRVRRTGAAFRSICLSMSAAFMPFDARISSRGFAAPNGFALADCDACAAAAPASARGWSCRRLRCIGGPEPPPPPSSCRGYERDGLGGPPSDASATASVTSATGS